MMSMTSCALKCDTDKQLSWESEEKELGNEAPAIMASMSHTDVVTFFYLMR